jgi:predicted nucleic acid-binding protein
MTPTTPARTTPASTTEWWFPDNTVLCNFAAVDRLALLEKVLDGRGRWSEAVAREARLSARHLPPLAALTERGTLGEPIELTDPDERTEVERLRRAVFGGDRRRPTQHLGEAETLTLITRRRDFRRSVWISDDRDAARYARRRGITTLETFDLVRAAVLDELVDAAEGHRLLQRMAEAGRRLHHTSTRPEDLLGPRPGAP